MLDFVRQSPSRLKSADDARTWETLEELDHSLSFYGPQNASVRAQVKQHANSIQLRLEGCTYPNSEQLRQYVRALEILRDAGAETSEELWLRKSQAWTAISYYRHIRDIPSLARALHAFANVCRLLGDKATCWRMTRWALLLLEEQRQPLSLNQRLVLHQASYWDLRSCAEGYGDAQANRKRDDVLDMARMINTPLTWLQTWQELAGYYGMLGKAEEAEEALSKLDDLKRTIDLDSMGSPTLLRPKIEFYIERDRKEQAIDIIEREYLPAYRANPRQLFLGHLQRWGRDLGLSLPVDLPSTYETPMLIYVPRGEL
jgi:tetratricopeptide (TPR) repeat protein